MAGVGALSQPLPQACPALRLAMQRHALITWPHCFKGTLPAARTGPPKCQQLQHARPMRACSSPTPELCRAAGPRLLSWQQTAPPACPASLHDYGTALGLGQGGLGARLAGLPRQGVPCSPRASQSTSCRCRPCPARRGQTSRTPSAWPCTSWTPAAWRCPARPRPCLQCCRPCPSAPRLRTTPAWPATSALARRSPPGRPGVTCWLACPWTRVSRLPRLPLQPACCPAMQPPWCLLHDLALHGRSAATQPALLTAGMLWMQDQQPTPLVGSRLRSRVRGAGADPVLG